jgi:hypothetical protein
MKKYRMKYDMAVTIENEYYLLQRINSWLQYVLLNGY